MFPEWSHGKCPQRSKPLDESLAAPQPGLLGVTPNVVTRRWQFPAQHRTGTRCASGKEHESIRTAAPAQLCVTPPALQN